MAAGLPLMKSVLTPPLAKRVLLPLRVTASAPVRDGAIQKKTYWF